MASYMTTQAGFVGMTRRLTEQLGLHRRHR